MIVKMLEGIRAKGKRAIVYDTAGTFVEKFYREGKDILLNPLDERSAVWSPWVDVPHDYHYDQIAESTIPDKHAIPSGRRPRAVLWSPFCASSQRRDGPMYRSSSTP